jgi:hypothetical protein
MSYTSETPILRSPQQAANTFSQPGGFPRQRNVYIIRFIPNGGQTNFSNLTFAAKSIERPKINPKTEELHQYNKKRQVYTGFKIEPVRVHFSTAMTALLRTCGHSMVDTTLAT